MIMVCLVVLYISNASSLQILVGLLRHYVTLLLNSPPKKQAAAAVREQCVWRVCRELLANIQTRFRSSDPATKHSPNVPPSAQDVPVVLEHARYGTLFGLLHQAQAGGQGRRGCQSFREWPDGRSDGWDEEAGGYDVREALLAECIPLISGCPTWSSCSTSTCFSRASSLVSGQLMFVPEHTDV